MAFLHIIIIVTAPIIISLAIVSLPLLHQTYYSVWKSSLSRPPVANLVLTNGVIYTSDDTLPFAESMAVANGRVLRVGNNSFVQELAGYGTQVLDLGGKVVVPGFIDSHVHFICGGLQMMQVNLRGVNKKEEFIRRVKVATQNTKQGSWILGGGWNNDLWGGDLPAASWIDDVTPNNPVWLSRMDGHMGLANSVALMLARISNLTDNPKGGTIVRTAGGEPTGLLIDSASTLVNSQIPEASVDDRREALLRASNLALTRGVTTVVDVGRYIPGVSADLSWEDFSDVYQWASSMSKMKVRVCLFFPMQTWSRLVDVINKMGHTFSQWIYLGGVKAFADGSLGSRSALFYEPYAGDLDNYGLQVTEPEALLNMTLESDLNGLQVAIHAIGDKANDLILDIYDLVTSTNGIRDRRFRIEHAQHLASGTPGRFGKQQVVASMQPDHLLDEADTTSKKLGKDRAEKGSYLFGSLLDNNALVAFGSDWPVADINPLSGIKTAMKRRPSTWESAWIPSECISLDDAIKAYTISAARASFLDNDLGSLSPGKLADFVILSTDSWKSFAEEASASVEETYVSGELAGYGTQVLDLGGKVVVPGFIDSHVHFICGGLQMMQVNLRGVNKKEEFIRRVKVATQNTKQGSWILGGGWNNDLWGGDLPAASWIDDVTPNNPVWLSRMDGHMGLANSVALMLARISNLTDNPKGGTIVRTAGGEPTGLLIDSASTLVNSQIPEASVDDRREALLRASNLALTRGVTTVVDVGRYIPGVSADLSWEDFSDVYQWASSMSKMKVRVCLFFPMQTWSRLVDVINKMGHTFSQWIYLGGVKAFADGSLGSRSALFYEPYAGDLDNYGLQVTEPEALLNMTLESDLNGLQVAIHAIGDKANDLILDIYDLVTSTNGIRDRRFRIEHAQHLASGTPGRFGKQQVVASMQPDHLLDEADTTSKKLGKDRAEKGSYLFGSLLDNNALVAFGSDWPVADINPLSGIKTAMKRRPSTWESAWIPSECISLDDAIKAYTISAARASFLDNDLGSLSPGKLADFVILSTDSWKSFAEEASASVEETYVSGVRAYP